MDGWLTQVEFARIRKNLEYRSDTWAELWFLLNLTQARVTHLLRCRYQDLQEGELVLPAYSIFEEKRIPLNPTERVIIAQRRKRYPNDVFLFQSHSPRIKASVSPISLIGFNAALKKAARDITCKTVSSKSALHVNHDIPIPLNMVV
ncbi:hypothetical protein [Enterobacter cloacae complex sp. ESBL7]|uniref:hypothetical protein n=1 Tax=Enterobacter cloacae complex sp. ESBL7 TaxID=3163325 RepID=UPI0035661972